MRRSVCSCSPSAKVSNTPRMTSYATSFSLVIDRMAVVTVAVKKVVTTVMATIQTMTKKSEGYENNHQDSMEHGGFGSEQDDSEEKDGNNDAQCVCACI